MLSTQTALIGLSVATAIALIVATVALVLNRVVSYRLNKEYVKKVVVDQQLAEAKELADAEYEPKGASGHVVKALTDKQLITTGLPESTKYVVRPYSKFSAQATRPEGQTDTVVSFWAHVTEGWGKTDEMLFTLPNYGGVKAVNKDTFTFVTGDGSQAGDMVLATPLKTGKWYHFAFHLTPKDGTDGAPETVCTVYVNGDEGTPLEISEAHKYGDTGHVAPGRIVVDLPEGSSLAHLGVVYGSHKPDEIGALVSNLKSNNVSKVHENAKTKIFHYLDLSDSRDISLH